MELDQTPRVSLSLFRLVSPFVTVHSRTPGVDSRTAPPALFAALADYSQEDIRAFTETPFPNNIDRSDPRYPSDFNQIGNNDAVLVHIEVILRTGQTSVREAVISFREASGAAFAIKELRRGQGRSLVRLRASLHVWRFSCRQRDTRSGSQGLTDVSSSSVRRVDCSMS
jgi:general secretion pathway protein K